MEFIGILLSRNVTNSPVFWNLVLVKTYYLLTQVFIKDKKY